MDLEVKILNLEGISPYNIYLCEANGEGCFYVNTIISAPYNFIIPPPKNNLNEYMLVAKDANGRIISGTTFVT
jgi:hypothetical protein